MSIITPDAERTMRTCLAVSSHLAARHVPADKIAASEWLFVEGYVFANPSTGQHAIREALKAAKAARHEGRADVFGRVRPAGVRRRVPRGAGAERPAVLQRDRGDGRRRRRDRGGGVRAS